MKDSNQRLSPDILLKKVIPITEQVLSKDTVPLVSISCTVYNQKDYIINCIEGFLSQETSFPVEIIIHDDASTDGTSEIIRTYQIQYPKLITSTIQLENQFSKGKNINHLNLSKARGKFIALCHGDDFWTDKHKLEKQVEAMQFHDAHISGHPAHEIDVKDRYLGKTTGFQIDTLTHFSSKELIKRQGNMLPFGSIMITNEAKDDFLKYMPPVMFHSGVQLLGALRGGVLVLPDIMMAYRTFVPGSTTEIMLGDLEKKVATTIKRIGSIKALKSLYGKEYYFLLNNFLASQIIVTFQSKKQRYSWRVIQQIMKQESLSDKVVLGYYCFLFKLKDSLSKNKQLLIKFYTTFKK